MIDMSRHTLELNCGVAINQTSKAILSDLVHVAVHDSSCGWSQMTARARTGRLFSGRRNGPFRRNRVIPMGRDKALLSTRSGHRIGELVLQSGLRRFM